MQMGVGNTCWMSISRPGQFQFPKLLSYGVKQYHRTQLLYGVLCGFFFVGGRGEGGFGVSFGVDLRDGCCCYCCRRLLLLSLASSKPIHNIRTPLGIWVVTRIMAYCRGIVIYNQINSMCCCGLYNIVFQNSINKFQILRQGFFFN